MVHFRGLCFGIDTLSAGGFHHPRLFSIFWWVRVVMGGCYVGLLDGVGEPEEVKGGREGVVS